MPKSEKPTNRAITAADGTEIVVRTLVVDGELVIEVDRLDTCDGARPLFRGNYKSRALAHQGVRPCFACGRKLGQSAATVTCADEQTVEVGRECYAAIVRAGAAGWQPPQGGPRLYALQHDPKARDAASESAP